MLAAGVLTGIAGGIGMVGVTIGGAVLQDEAALHALDVIGASFVGEGGFESDAARLAFGALVHLATSAALGVLFAALLPRDFPTASALVVGQGFALATIMFLMPLIVPWANPGLRIGMQDIGGTWVLAHAAFGFAVGMAPAVRRRLVHAAEGGTITRPRARASAPASA